MRIGVDIDGVLTDLERFLLDYGSEFYIKNTERHLECPNVYGSKKIYNANDEEDLNFWERMATKYNGDETPRRFAVEVLNLLKSEGHEIYLITSRLSDLSYCKLTVPEMEELTFGWLRKYQIPYDKIVFAAKSKVKDLKDNKIDIMIEDHPRNVVELSKICKVLCFDARYNVGIEDKNIVRVYSWFDIYDKIKQLCK